MLGIRYDQADRWVVPSFDRLTRTRTIELSIGSGPELLRRLMAGEVDCMLTSARNPVLDLTELPLVEEAYAFVGAPHLLETEPLRDPSDAMRHTLIDAFRGLPLFRYLTEATPSVPWTFARTELLGTAGLVRIRALAGAGVAVLPRHLVAADLVAGALVEPMPDLPIASDWFRLVWRPAHPQAHALEALGGDLRETFPHP